MRVLIVSFGSIARRHLANLRQFEPEVKVTLLRRAIDPTLAEDQVTTLDEALTRNPDAALVCSPASEHIAVARVLAERGIALFVEKPLAHSLDGVADLLALATERRVPLMVGYCLRYLASLRAAREALQTGRIGRLLHIHAEVGMHLADWRPAADYRTVVTAQRALGGGALLELSHELDYVRWLAGEVEGVAADLARVSDLEIDVEDCADLTLRFASGARGTVHLDLLARPAFRRCRMIGTTGTIEVDLIADRARLFTEGKWQDINAPGADRNAMYLAELRHFLDCVRDRLEPDITGHDGLKVLEIIESARTSSREATSKKELCHPERSGGGKVGGAQSKDL